MPVVSVPNPASSWINGAKLQLCHASTSADLTDPSSWTFSNNVQISGTLINGDTSKGFWEPNILLDQNGDCKIVTRVNSDLRINLGAVVDVTLGESASISYNTTTGLRTVPGGHVFYKVLWDSQSQKYLAISTRNTRGNANSTDFIQRTVLQLISSPDLTTWTHVADIVREPQYETLEKTILAGWQYSDWEFDGNDIVGIIRVGEYGIAINQHQASAIYFVRIKNYYPNLLAAAPTNSGASPSSPHAAVTGGGPFGFSSFGRSAFGAYETGRSIFVPYVVVCPRCLGSGVI
jgi:hypothetical protein